ncbi:MAG: hypothetical protein D6790_10775 [Caldilineae bacterium]|nr:MAG: hypothetical protein D6790_10775 [Caldilineae bacterium]
MRYGLLILLLLLAGCAGSAPVAVEGEEAVMVWPLPPDPPRVRYEGEIRGSRQVDERPGLFERIKRFLLGTSPASEAIAIRRPFDVYADAAGRLFVSSGEAGYYIVLDTTGRARVVRPTGAGTLAKPMGLGGDATGRLYVADPVQRRVVAFDAVTGDFLTAYGGRGVLLNPVDVAASPDGARIYVADSYLHQVVVFARDGELLRRIGRDVGDLAAKEARLAVASGTEPFSRKESSDLRENRSQAPGAFHYPAFVEVGPKGTLYVVDAMNFRVQAFDPDGRYLFHFGRPGDTPGSFARPKGIAVDSEGHIYVVDAAFNNVQIFDPEGRLLMAFGGLGTGPGTLWLPLGIAIDTRDRIYVADRYNNRIQHYQYLAGPADENPSSSPGASDAP